MGEWGGGGGGSTGGSWQLSLVGRLRHGIKRGLEIAVVRSGIADRRARDPKRRRLILAYHNVVADDDPPWGERALHLKRSLFEQHIDLLQEKGRIVPLRELLEDVDQGLGDRPRFALTFDDAYRGAIEAIESFLVPRGIPCTVFINPGLIGIEAFWWDRVAEVHGGGIPIAARRQYLEEFRGETESIEAHLRRAGPLVLSPPSQRYAPPGLDELTHLRSLGGLVQLGSHTWSHPNLVALSSPEVQTEISRCRSWLETFSGTGAGILAYPYGLATSQVRGDTKTAGCEYGVLVEGSHLPETDADLAPFALPRLPVPAGLSVEGLMVRVAGIRG